MQVESTTESDLEPTRALACEGITSSFIDRIRTCVRLELVRKADVYFQDGGSPDAKEDPVLKSAERWVNYYDYQPCAVSVLGALAAEGNSQAASIVRNIIDNARHYLGTQANGPLYPIPLRRSPLHLALCYERLGDSVPQDTNRLWRDLIAGAVEWLLRHFNNLEADGALDNRAFGTGINHVAVAAEGIWTAGRALHQPSWQDAAGSFINRLIEYSHRDGYFEENTNDAREGGPSLAYTPLTAGCAYTVQREGGALDLGFFKRCGACYRNLHDTRLRPLAFSDERANPVDHRAHRPFGRALHALTPEGRGFLRLILDPDLGHCHYDRMSLEHLARLDFELDQMACGPGALPEPLQDGAFRLQLPLGVVRSNAWTVGLSALRALNHEASPNSDYALDRQSLVHLSHDTAGVILPGLKSKRDPLWSTVRIGDDAYPTKTGTLDLADDGISAEAHYGSYSVNLTWIVKPSPVLELASPADRVLTTQLALAVGQGESLHLDSGRVLLLSEENAEVSNVTTISTDTWVMEADRPGRLVWPIRPFDPYTTDNATRGRSTCCLFSVDWQGKIRFKFESRTAT